MAADPGGGRSPRAESGTFAGPVGMRAHPRVAVNAQVNVSLPPDKRWRKVGTSTDSKVCVYDHLTRPGTLKIIGFEVGSYQTKSLVLNSMIGPYTTFRKTSAKFCQWRHNEEKKFVYGLSFASEDDCLEVAEYIEAYLRTARVEADRLASTNPALVATYTTPDDDMDPDRLKAYACPRDSVNILKSGLLSKSAGSGHLFSSPWDSRWFVLTEESLRYYASKKDASKNPDKPRGTILLDDVLEIGQSIVMGALEKNSAAFDVVTSSRRYTVFGGTVAESRDWMVTVQNVWNPLYSLTHLNAFVVQSIPTMTVRVIEPREVAGQVFAVSAKAAKVGSLESNDISLQDWATQSVSRAHCEIAWDVTTSCFTITDTNSSNGTFVNGVRIAVRKAVPLVNGTIVTLGKSVTFVTSVLDLDFRGFTGPINVENGATVDPVLTSQLGSGSGNNSPTSSLPPSSSVLVNASSGNALVRQQSAGHLPSEVPPMRRNNSASNIQLAASYGSATPMAGASGSGGGGGVGGSQPYRPVSGSVPSPGRLGSPGGQGGGGGAPAFPAGTYQYGGGALAAPPVAIYGTDELSIQAEVEANMASLLMDG